MVVAAAVMAVAAVDGAAALAECEAADSAPDGAHCASSDPGTRLLHPAAPSCGFGASDHADAAVAVGQFQVMDGQEGAVTGAADEPWLPAPAEELAAGNVWAVLQEENEACSRSRGPGYAAAAVGDGA